MCEFLCALIAFLIVLQWKCGNLLGEKQPNFTETSTRLFLLWDDKLLPLINVPPLSKSMDRWKTQGETVSTLRWWTVATYQCASFKQIDGQVENQRRNFFYFAMMICCCWWISVLQGHLGTGWEPKEKLFLLWDDDLLLLMDLHPSRKLMDRSRTEGETVYTLRWWSVPADGSPSFKEIDGQIENRRRKCLYFAMMIRSWKHMILFTY